jgi:pSer/pThr/pTyr-binding forkhead associated (FHA) protein
VRVCTGGVLARATMVEFLVRPLPELILSLRERELGRFAIVAKRTTIGRDPSCDVVIDNAGISRLHASIEAVGDSFVVRDLESQNGFTLNGEPCREGRLVHGDILGLNKFLLRFSNDSLEAPKNLKSSPDLSRSDAPKEVQRTMHVGPEEAKALAEIAKAQIERQRAERAARGDMSAAQIEPPPPPPPAAKPRVSLRWEEAASTGVPLQVVVGAFLIGGLIAGLLVFALS